MAYIPYHNDKKILAGVNWNINTRKVEMESGSELMVLTLGGRPFVHTAAISWLATPAEMATIINTLEADGMVGRYQYTCPVRGEIIIQCMGSGAFPEPAGDEKLILTLDFRRV